MKVMQNRATRKVLYVHERKFRGAVAEAQPGEKHSTHNPLEGQDDVRMPRTYAACSDNNMIEVRTGLVLRINLKFALRSWLDNMININMFGTSHWKS